MEHAWTGARRATLTDLTGKLRQPLCFLHPAFACGLQTVTDPIFAKLGVFLCTLSEFVLLLERQFVQPFSFFMLRHLLSCSLSCLKCHSLLQARLAVPFSTRKTAHTTICWLIGLPSRRGSVRTSLLSSTSLSDHGLMLGSIVEPSSSSKGVLSILNNKQLYQVPGQKAVGARTHSNFYVRNYITLLAAAPGCTTHTCCG